MVTPAQRKQIVKGLVSEGRHSERSACELTGISRSAYRYQGNQADKDRKLEASLLEKAKQYPHYGYKMLHALLKGEGRYSERSACELTGISRSAYRYQGNQPIKIVNWKPRYWRRQSSIRIMAIRCCMRF